MLFQIAGLCFTDASGLPFHQDPRLIVLSYLVAVFGAFAALEMVERWRNAGSDQAPYWQLAAAATLGGSIWSMHFVGMLALTISMPMTYTPLTSILAFLTAVIAAWCSLQMLAPSASRLRICSAGITLGLGISAMHYIGMAGMQFPGTLGYMPMLFGASVLIGIAAATAALWLSLRLQKRWHRATASLIMGGAICGMHYTGVAAAVFQGHSFMAAQWSEHSGYPLGIAVTLTTLVLLACGLTFVGVNRLLLASTLREAETLRDSNGRLAQVNADLALSRGRLGVVLNTISQGISFYDSERRLVVWNRRFNEIYNLPPGTLRSGISLSEVIGRRYGAGTNSQVPLPDYLASREQIATTNSLSKTVETLANGNVVAIYHHPLPDGGWVSTHEDITEQKQAEDKIAFLARHDPLTQLPNRRLFQESLETSVAMAVRGAGCALLCLDLDHFKFVNDTLGHPAGDDLLRQVTKRLQACVRGVDILARLGGDEFVVIQSGVTQPEDASNLANRIVATIGQPFEIDGHQVTCGVSVGIALAPSDGTSPDTLLQHADIALYLAKSEGRGTARFFEPEMDARIQLRRTVEQDLENAVVRNEFELYFQPSLNLSGDRIDGYEALLRWHHPTRGLIGPDKFISIAEENGMIVPIGEWALHTACREAAKWPADIKVAVNVSPAQFKRGNVVAIVKSSLAASGLQPNRLELEITESVLMGDAAEITETLAQLREMGVQLALDDFGTGYSSLSYLRKFPFGKIKIDQSFVRDLAQHKGALAIVRAVHALAKSLGMTTTVEGVETTEQLAEIRQVGCTSVQGYLVSPPRPANQVLSLIAGFQPMSLSQAA